MFNLKMYIRSYVKVIAICRLRQREETLLKVLQFWLDVDDFIKQNDKKEDRLYRVYSAWNIFNTYINDGTVYPMLKTIYFDDFRQFQYTLYIDLCPSFQESQHVLQPHIFEIYFAIASVNLFIRSS